MRYLAQNISRYIPENFKDIIKENVSVVDKVRYNALICFDLIIRNPHGGKMEE